MYRMNALPWGLAYTAAGLQDKFVACRLFLESYRDWFFQPSKICRFYTKHGLWYSVFILFLFSVHLIPKIPHIGSDLVNIDPVTLLIVSPLLFIVIILLPDMPRMPMLRDAAGTRHFVALFYFAPLIIYWITGSFRGYLPLLAVLGVVTAGISYLVDRFEGYTKAWSRYRTFGFLLEILIQKHKAQLLTDDEAHLELLALMEKEVIQRHGDIVDDMIGVVNQFKP